MAGNEIFAKAMQVISKRAQDAKLEAMIHMEEIQNKLPEVFELKKEISKTSIELAKIILSGAPNAKQLIEDLRQRNLYIQDRISMLLAQNGYGATYLDVVNTCNECHDTGYIGNEKCGCLKTLLRELSIQELNQCSPLKISQFSSFNLDYYNNTLDSNGNSSRKTMTKIYDYCKRYAERFSLLSQSVFMLGDTGLGKTHLSLAIAGKVIEKGYHVLYGSMQDFLRAIEDEHFGRSNHEQDTLRLLLETDLLILDDLGVEFNSEFNVATVYNIINTRLNADRPTIINSNLSVTEIEKKYTKRIVSRLFSNYTCLRFAGNDIRLQKKAGKFNKI